MHPIGKKVAFRRRELKMTQHRLAHLAGMKQQSIQSIEDGKVERPRRLRELAQALKTTQEWLLSKSDASESFNVVPDAIPVFGEVAAGLWHEPHDESDLSVRETLPTIPGLFNSLEGIYALEVKGNSMDAVAPDGAFVICLDIAASGSEIEDGDLVIVERRRKQGGLREVTIKRVERTKGGFYLIPESSDPKWKPILYDRKKADADTEIAITARVVMVANIPRRRKKRPIKIDE